MLDALEPAVTVEPAAADSPPSAAFSSVPSHVVLALPALVSRVASRYESHVNPAVPAL